MATPDGQNSEDDVRFQLPIDMSPEELEAIAALDSIRHFKKGTHLLRTGEHPQYSYFVVKGCVRQYQLVHGEDKTSYFYTENQSIFFPNSNTSKIPSRFNLECLEDSELKVVSVDQERELYARFPRFEKICRITTEEALGDFQAMFAEFIASSPEQRYLKLQATRPDLLNRVPQYHLASYLGVKPESLSRIRKRILRRS